MFIFGIIFLSFIAANTAAYLLGISRRNWLYAIGISMRYIHMVSWASFLVILVSALKYRPTVGSAFVIALASAIFGYGTERLQQRLEMEGKLPPP